MHSILYWYVLHTFYVDGMYNTPKNGMLSVRRDFIPKKYVMHTFVLTVYSGYANLLSLMHGFNTVLFLSIGTLYHYELSFADSVRLTLQNKIAKLCMRSFIHSTKLTKHACIINFICG